MHSLLRIVVTRLPTSLLSTTMRGTHLRRADELGAVREQVARLLDHVKGPIREASLARDRVDARVDRAVREEHDKDLGYLRVRRRHRRPLLRLDLAQDRPHIL
eukprot:3173206-Pleurochrysis_carterae.AAC.2